ncbi:hypothetical protein H9Q70_007830 [Fusarium xylarioides]|nr:hypothetical protein H9Q70_007830 [Fusarium xylarioides]KAG5784081.1 hypothetical protein H9Q73_002280 [Fusarium xylarioides]
MAFRAGLLDANGIPPFRHTYAVNQPFPHLVVQDVMQDDFLRRVRDEIDDSLGFNFDENDFHRTWRSTHLANISNSDEYAPDLLPNLTRLRDTLNGPDFREWLSSITGVGPLSGTRSSMAINLYTPGDHLLVHDDCNPKSRNRRISFILYLTHPDNIWKPEWGGGLRLYACEPRSTSTASRDVVRTVQSTWSKCIQPCFNRLVFFGLRPGETYHEVEQVLQSGDMMVDQHLRRLAISGWFHAAQEGDQGFDEAFYRADVQRMEYFYQLKATAFEFHEPQIAFMPFADGHMDGQDVDFTLTRHDIGYLSRYIAPELLSQGLIVHTSHHFLETHTLQLQPFLCEQFEAKVRQYLEEHDHTHSTFHGSDTTLWKTANPPNKQRFLYLEGSAVSSNPSNPILQLLVGLLRSRAFGKWLALVTGLEMYRLEGQHAIARRFRRGLDYILTDPQNQVGDQLDYTLLITPTSCCRTASVKGMGRNSGEEIYRSAGDHAVELAFTNLDRCYARSRGCGYRNSVPMNTFSAILRKSGMQSIVSYVSRAAIGDRLDIKGNVQLKNDNMRHE